MTTADPLPFVLLPSRLDLYSGEDHTEAFIEELNHWKSTFDDGLELVVIDTFSTATPGANENDGKDVSQVLERCARISERTDAAVLLVHHMNADGAKVRGHTSLLANLENVLLVKVLADHHDDNRRQIREAVLDKNKDGEAGQSFKFVLKSVTIGIDSDGDPVTSCVVLQPDGAASDMAQSERPNVTNSESLLMRAIDKAIKTHGVLAPESLSTQSGDVQVVDWKFVRDAYDTLAFDGDRLEGESDDDRARRLETRRKAMNRGGESLLRKGLIGRDNPYIWRTKRRVKGHREIRPVEKAAPELVEEVSPQTYGDDDPNDPKMWSD